jgi:hypothetical protein
MNILFELPKGNKLRDQLQDLKSEMESMFDKFLASRDASIFLLYFPKQSNKKSFGIKVLSICTLSG